MPYIIFVLRIVAFLAGISLVVYVITSAIRTFVLPRSAFDKLSHFTFVAIRNLFNIRLAMTHTYEEKDRILALYAPVGLIALPGVWLVCVLLGYTAMLWGVTGQPWYSAYKLSGSSLFTLGFAIVDNFVTTTLLFSEAALGLFLLSLLIAYLPTMYAAFAKREAAVTMLEVRAGSPPSAIEMLTRFHKLQRMDKLNELWVSWELWFVELEESHTSLAALNFFRSPRPQRSWVTAAGAVLDAAALYTSTLDMPKDTQADLCIRAGYLALRYIADFFGIENDADPQPDDSITVSRAEFDSACDQLASEGVPLKADRDQAWRDFAGWRVNYDRVLVGLAHITVAPYALWSSDRALDHTNVTHGIRKAS